MFPVEHWSAVVERKKHTLACLSVRCQRIDISCTASKSRDTAEEEISPEAKRETRLTERVICVSAVRPLNALCSQLYLDRSTGGHWQESSAQCHCSQHCSQAVGQFQSFSFGGVKCKIVFILFSEKCKQMFELFFAWIIIALLIIAVTSERGGWQNFSFARRGDAMMRSYSTSTLNLSARMNTVLNGSCKAEVLKPLRHKEKKEDPVALSAVNLAENTNHQKQQVLL